jgi:hypothetical protein
LVPQVFYFRIELIWNSCVTPPFIPRSAAGLSLCQLHFKVNRLQLTVRTLFSLDRLPPSDTYCHERSYQKNQFESKARLPTRRAGLVGIVKQVEVNDLTFRENLSSTCHTSAVLRFLHFLDRFVVGRIIIVWRDVRCFESTLAKQSERPGQWRPWLGGPSKRASDCMAIEPRTPFVSLANPVQVVRNEPSQQDANKRHRYKE